MAISVNPVYGAINKRLLVFGVERKMFCASFGVSVVIFYIGSYFSAWGYAVALGFLVGAMALSRFVTKRDEKMPEVFIAACRHGEVYDPALRK